MFCCAVENNRQLVGFVNLYHRVVWQEPEMFRFGILLFHPFSKTPLDIISHRHCACRLQSSISFSVAFFNKFILLSTIRRLSGRCVFSRLHSRNDSWKFPSTTFKDYFMNSRPVLFSLELLFGRPQGTAYLCGARFSSFSDTTTFMQAELS